MTDQVKDLIEQIDPDITKCSDCDNVIDLTEDSFVKRDEGCICIKCYEKWFKGPKLVKPSHYKFIYNLKCQI